MRRFKLNELGQIVASSQGMYCYHSDAVQAINVAILETEKRIFSVLTRDSYFKIHHKELERVILKSVQR